jgi:hypothetical protein
MQEPVNALDGPLHASTEVDVHPLCEVLRFRGDRDADVANSENDSPAW